MGTYPEIIHEWHMYGPTQHTWQLLWLPSTKLTVHFVGRPVSLTSTMPTWLGLASLPTQLVPLPPFQGALTFPTVVSPMGPWSHL